MDLKEKRVLRRKRLLLSQRLLLNNENLKKLKEFGVINQSARNLIQKEANNGAKVNKLLELHTATSDTFHNLCQMIDTSDSDLADELRAELKAEKGNLKVEEYIQEEAEILIEREFGSTKRITKIEKQELADLVAQRTQIVNETYRRRMKTKKEELENGEHEYKMKRDKIMQLLKKLKDGELNGKISLINESDDINEDEESIPELSMLEKYVTGLCDAILQLEKEHTTLLDERIRAADILEMDDPKERIYPVLSDKIDDAEKEIEHLTKIANKKEITARGLQKEVDRIREEMKNNNDAKEKKIETLSSHKNISSGKVDELQREVDRLEKELAGIEEKINGYKSKAKELEKHRRLGYKVSIEDEFEDLELRLPAIQLQQSSTEDRRNAYFKSKKRISLKSV